MPMDTIETWPDEQLAREAQAGSSACFEQLVRRYQTRLLAFLLRSVSHADAEDLTQDAFVQAYVALDRYQSKWRFKTWLFVIAQRLMIDRLRQRKRRGTGREVQEADAVSADDSSERATAREQSARLWTIARDTLGDEPMRALWLHYVEGMETREVARVMGRSWVWVKTTLHRARRKLAPALNEYAPSAYAPAERPSRAFARELQGAADEPMPLMKAGDR